MPAPPVELLLIRHAEADHGGRLVGRTDVPAFLPPDCEIARLRAAVGTVATVSASPACRCRLTAEALFPDVEVGLEPDLWEQDFGDFDGLPFSEIPDLGPLPRGAIAAHRWPGGESFLDMCRRVEPVLRRLVGGGPSGRVAIIAHAGTVRAALGIALGDPAQGLAFEVAPLSATVFRWHSDDVAIVRTNSGLAG